MMERVMEDVDLWRCKATFSNWGRPGNPSLRKVRRPAVSKLTRGTHFVRSQILIYSACQTFEADCHKKTSPLAEKNVTRVSHYLQGKAPQWWAGRRLRCEGECLAVSSYDPFLFTIMTNCGLDSTVLRWLPRTLLTHMVGFLQWSPTARSTRQHEIWSIRTASEK
jgi:hypothetical protein